MTFKEWKNYWKKMNWTQKWFPVFILLRPIADNFYFLKQVSPFISPLYILGALIPLLIFFSFRTTKLHHKIPSGDDGFMQTFGIVILVNCVFLLMYQFSLENFGSVIKYLTPPLLFFYVRRFIQSKEDIVFLLQTFLYSCSFPFAILAFETFVHPLNPDYLSAGRGGGYRVHGAYSDCMNYAIYFIGAFLVYCYFFLGKVYAQKSLKEKLPSLNLKKLLN